MLKVCVAGATGWTGRAVAEGVRAADDLVLASGVSRTHAGRDLGEAWGGEPLGVPVFATPSAAALDGVDVVVDYTSHEVVKAHVLAALDAGVPVVAGSSGLTAADFVEIEQRTRTAGAGVVASGNFSVTAAMAQAATLLAVRRAPELSGLVRGLASLLVEAKPR